MNKPLPAAVLAAVLGVLVLAWAMSPWVVEPRPYQEFDTVSFGRVPVSYGGRYKPMDTVARNSLTILSGKQTFEKDGEKQPAIVWLLDVKVHKQEADGYPVPYMMSHGDVRLVLNKLI